MPAGPADIGITSATGTLLESVEWEKKVEERIIKDKDGGFGDGKAFDPVIEFSVKGRGETDAEVGLGAAGITAITGGATIITKVKLGQKNDDFETFEYSGSNYPGA
jgi:hypothetical protein